MNISFKEFLKAGLISGTISIILANTLYALLVQYMNVSFVELNFISISLTSLIANMLGSVVYYVLIKKTKDPISVFSIIALVIAIGSSVPLYIKTQPEGLPLIATALHFLVALVAVVAIPSYFLRKQ